MNDLRQDVDVVRQTRPSGREGSAWAGNVAALLFLIVAITALFYSTASSIVAIWQRSETFAHGFLIVPISLWLVWEKRKGLRRLQPVPAVAPLALMMPIGLLWLVGNLADALVVQQFAYVGVLAVVIWATVGHRNARYLAFPIVFLFFAVPVGQGLVYPLMEFTADFTVGALELTGIPVYREGTFFTIPSGRWSVVEACSGVRYLIASVTLGVLFAYLTYSCWWKRVLFVVASAVIPIIANGLRAYMIVMIGHLSDMKLAVGVDHLIYGWVFFGVIVTIMFVVGSLWRDPLSGLPEPRDPRRARSRGRLPAVLLLSPMAAGVWPLLAYTPSDGDSIVATVDVASPHAVGAWSLADETEHWDWRPRIVGPDGEVYALYEKEREPVSLYLGIYRVQRQGAEVVSSSNVMVPEKHRVWTDWKIEPRAIEIGDSVYRIEQHHLSSRLGQRLLVWTWYRIGHRHTANEYWAKAIQAANRLTGGGGGGAVIAVAAPYDSRPETAARSLEEFLETMLPRIDAAIDRALSGANGDS